MRPPRTVLVLGWGNSTRRQLAPFEELWRELGDAPTVVVPDTVRWLLDPRLLRRRTAELAARRWDVVHALSDNGFVAWSMIAEDQLARGAAAPSAVVLDSCPGVARWRTRTGFAAAFGRGMTPAALRALGRPEAATHPVVTPAIELVFRLLHRLLPQSIEGMTGAVERTLRLPSPVAHLVVCGPDDRVVAEDDVLAHAAALRRAGHPVTSLRIAGSGHVGHLRRDRAAYLAAVRAL